MIGGQGIDHLVERRAAFHHFAKAMHGQADAVVGDAPLRKIVGPDALRSVTRADLVLAGRGSRVVGLLALQLVEPRPHHLHREAAVLMLRFLGRDDHDARGYVEDADGRFRLVDVLAAGATGPHGVDPEFFGLDLEVDLLWFRQHRDRRRRRMDTAARLRRRNALHAVDAGLEFQSREHAFALRSRR